MVQVGFGIGQGPNGPQMMPVIMPSQAPAEPESYESHLETPEGVYVKVTYHTKNKAAADRYADELAQRSGWKSLEKSPEQPMSLFSEVALSWVIALIAGFALPFIAVMGAEILRGAHYISRDSSEVVWNNLERIGIWTFVTAGITFTILAFTSRSSQDPHVQA